jgi:hypothetical protein
MFLRRPKVLKKMIGGTGSDQLMQNPQLSCAPSSATLYSSFNPGGVDGASNGSTSAGRVTVP